MKSTQNLTARIDCLFHAVISFGANISVFVNLEVLMSLEVVMTSLVAGVALLWRSGDSSEVRRDKTWKQ